MTKIALNNVQSSEVGWLEEGKEWVEIKFDEHPGRVAVNICTCRIQVQTNAWVTLMERTQSIIMKVYDSQTGDKRLRGGLQLDALHPLFKEHVRTHRGGTVAYKVKLICSAIWLEVPQLQTRLDIAVKAPEVQRLTLRMTIRILRSTKTRDRVTVAATKADDESESDGPDDHEAPPAKKAKHSSSVDKPEVSGGVGSELASATEGCFVAGTTMALIEKIEPSSDSLPSTLAGKATGFSYVGSEVAQPKTRPEIMKQVLFTDLLLHPRSDEVQQATDTETSKATTSSNPEPLDNKVLLVEQPQPELVTEKEVVHHDARTENVTGVSPEVTATTDEPSSMGIHSPEEVEMIEHGGVELTSTVIPSTDIATPASSITIQSTGAMTPSTAAPPFPRSTASASARSFSSSNIDSLRVAARNALYLRYQGSPPPAVQQLIETDIGALFAFYLDGPNGLPIFSLRLFNWLDENLGGAMPSDDI